MLRYLTAGMITLWMITGCVTTGPLTESQEEWIAQSAGNALGLYISLKEPLLAYKAKDFCEAFLFAQSLADRQKLFDSALAYLSKKHTGDSRVGLLASNILKAIGFSETEVAGYMGEQVGRLKSLTQKMIHLSLIAVNGVCEVM